MVSIKSLIKYSCIMSEYSAKYKYTFFWQFLCNAENCLQWNCGDICLILVNIWTFYSVTVASVVIIGCWRFLPFHRVACQQNKLYLFICLHTHIRSKMCSIFMRLCHLEYFSLMCHAMWVGVESIVFVSCLYILQLSKMNTRFAMKWFRFF